MDTGPRERGKQYQMAGADNTKWQGRQYQMAGTEKEWLRNFSPDGRQKEDVNSSSEFFSLDFALPASKL